MHETLSQPGWIAVANHDAVRIVAVDGGHVQDELLTGENAGALGWLKTEYLRP